ncbi:hypothetical protein U5N28_00150 [Lysinibacillus telephonicus]|uniref:Magnesium transporter MgtE intracellular domain-containing protein n=1 Tax=Lysinibacillus telephonicus TaxID=1714840 RepID=A0A431UVR3_9BACI|nr:hypothetical protein [Lysinibacillus telephonicus]RTQ95209.1 hypothetical protein EKG35_03620 [Lysinibacillus telephonicus]
MAKGKVQNANSIDQIEEEKSPGIFQKLFYLVLIPLLFVIAVLLVIATVTDFNVFEKASKLTGFSSEESAEESSVDYNKKIVELEAQVKEKEAEIAQLQSKLDSALAENKDNVAIQEQLQSKIESLQQTENEAKKEFEDILSTFEQMSAKSAAPIIAEMSDEEALKILSNMQPETLSAIFEKMDPAEAARYSELLSQ